MSKDPVLTIVWLLSLTMAVGARADAVHLDRAARGADGSVLLMNQAGAADPARSARGSQNRGKIASDTLS